jgi:thiamine biosynthesis lipoprotein
VAGATEAEIAAIEQLFARRDRVFSRFAANTELNRVNGRAGRPTLVSADFADMVELALTAADQTDGLVDPTLGLALEAAGYDRDFALLVDDPRPPGAPAPSGLAGVRLHGRVLALPAGVRLDLSGVVKAQTVDDALAILGGNGFVSAGGDLAARGGLSVALPGGGAVHLLLGGLATSGSDRRRWRRARAVQHHLIDPRTGVPARSPWEQVTVCARTCCGADVAAKAAFLLGHDGPDWLDGRGLPGRFRTADGAVAVNRSWRQSVAEHPCI